MKDYLNVWLPEWLSKSYPSVIAVGRTCVQAQSTYKRQHHMEDIIFHYVRSGPYIFNLS